MPQDGKISVTVQYLKFQPWPLAAPLAPLAGRIESLREQRDAEDFAPHECIAPSYMSST